MIQVIQNNSKVKDIKLNTNLNKPTKKIKTKLVFEQFKINNSINDCNSVIKAPLKSRNNKTLKQAKSIQKIENRISNLTSNQKKRRSDSKLKDKREKGKSSLTTFTHIKSQL